MPATPPKDTKPDAGAPDRGVPADLSSGSAKGSGAGAGGGAPEDYDSDSAGGAGGDQMPSAAPPPGKGADGPAHGSR